MSSRKIWLAGAVTAVVLATGGASYADDSPAEVPAPAAAPTASPAPPKAGYSSTGTWQLLALVNKRRHAAGLAPLTLDPKLASIARSWVERMVARDALSHNDALFSRSSHASLKMKALGENVGWNYSVAAQHAAFVNSPGHRSNLDMPGFRAAGFAVVRGADGRIWSTEDFGTPKA
jgi:uncharacterized protein YkwD